MTTWNVGQLWLYPFKSFPGVSVTEASVLASGALKYDREYAVVDTAGRFVNAKRSPRVHALRTKWNLSDRSVRISDGETGLWEQFHWEADKPRLEEWLSEFFREPVRVVRNEVTGFPDDRDSPGPTLVSQSTWAAIQCWFPELAEDEIRRRFRANVEISGMEPFGEDQLYGAPGHPRLIQLGKTQLWGVNPCQRCVVPTRQPDTGKVTVEFASRFATHREEHLPSWAAQEHFNHYYRLTVNTRAVRAITDAITIGDRVICP